MTSNHYFTYLCCLIGLLVSTAAQSPTKNPECSGMNRAKTSLEKGIGTFTKEPINCLVNNACTGLSCNGTHKSQPFYMSLKLQHCMKPDAEIHIDLLYPKRKLKVHQELKQDSTINLYKIANGQLKLKLNLKRTQNKITTSIIVETCIKYGQLPEVCKPFQPLLKPTTFCVNMNTCPKGQFNTTGYTPCHITPTPTQLTPKSQAQTTGSPKSSNPSTIHGVLTSKKPDLHSTQTESHIKSTNPSTIHGVVTTKKTTSDSHSTPSEPIGAKGHSKDDGHHHISVGVAVGIGFAVLAAILIVIGVVIYWKKFHHRSRLRAAYYNDISMNDPLYEDFGPEVA